MVSDDGVKVLILLFAKVEKLLAILKEELYGPPFGIGFYYLSASERGIGAQKDYPLIGLLDLEKTGVTILKSGICTTREQA